MLTRWTTINLMIMALLAGWVQLASNGFRVLETSDMLKTWAEAQKPIPHPEVLIAAAQAKFVTYEKALQERHLLLGMVVNQNEATGPMDVCDSLLFSSLRYVALKKMRWEAQANEAWEAIARSQSLGQWHRHPHCRQTTSRDMLLGLFAAFAVGVPEQVRELRRLITYLDNQNGFIDEGPFYVSFLSPGLANILELEALNSGFAPSELPLLLRSGFSTLELDTLPAHKGFVAHLAALTLWVEMELQAEQGVHVRSPEMNYGPIGKWVSVPTMKEQRFEWIAEKLMQTDGSNLFFRWLRLKSAHALTDTVKLRLLEELVEKFPAGLPKNCDREIDYLWQRDSSNMTEKSQQCSEEYAGVDYLWMAALLLEDLPRGPHALAH